MARGLKALAGATGLPQCSRQSGGTKDVFYMDPHPCMAIQVELSPSGFTVMKETHAGKCNLVTANIWQPCRVFKRWFDIACLCLAVLDFPSDLLFKD